MKSIGTPVKQGGGGGFGLGFTSPTLKPNLAWVFFYLIQPTGELFEVFGVKTKNEHVVQGGGGR